MTGRAKGLRTAVPAILKTPYGIAVLIAALLNLLLPSEKQEEEEVAKPAKDVELASTEA